MRDLSNWRSVRLWQAYLERDLRQRHSQRMHGLCIGVLTLAIMWSAAHLQMRLGYNSLAVRYFVTLGTGYLAYLLVLWIWARALLSDSKSSDAGLDAGGGTGDWGGGDFGGGGASGDFDGAGPMATFGASDAGSALGDVARGALEAVAGADESAVVVIPVVAIFLIGAAVLFGAGALLMLLFGWEVLLAVAVELAFSYVSARAAVRVVREGWLSAAVRLTWKPLPGAIACAVALGAAIDHFIPQATSLPQAIKLMRASQPL
jgi:hypothetical protein